MTIIMIDMIRRETCSNGATLQWEVAAEATEVQWAAGVNS